MKRADPRDVQTLWCLCSRYLTQHYAARLTARRLASAVGCSERTLFRMTRRCVGKTPLELVREVRVQEAEQLLKQGVKIEAVALLVGYRSRSSLYRAYRAAHGTTPGGGRMA